MRKFGQRGAASFIAMLVLVVAVVGLVAGIYTVSSQTNSVSQAVQTTCDNVCRQPNYCQSYCPGHFGMLSSPAGCRFICQSREVCQRLCQRQSAGGVTNSSGASGGSGGQQDFYVPGQSLPSGSAPGGGYGQSAPGAPATYYGPGYGH